jgi:hypothetical protein
MEKLKILTHLKYFVISGSENKIHTLSLGMFILNVPNKFNSFLRSDYYD